VRRGRPYHSRVRDRTLLLGSLTVVTAASGFGMLGVLASFAYDAGFDPMSFVAWRAGFGTLIVVAFAAWRIGRGRAFVAPWRLTTPGRVAFVTACSTALILNLGMFYAFERTTVAIVLLGFYTYPALVAAYEIATGHEPLDAVRVAALCFSLGGMVLVVAGGLTAGGDIRIDPLGIVFALVAAVAQTIFILVSRFGYSAIPAEQAMGWIIGATMISCAVLTLVGGGAAVLALPLREPTALAIAAFTGIFAAGIPSILFLTGIRAIGGTRTGVLMLFEPVVGVALAALLLSESIQAIQAVGGLAILVAAIVLQRSTPAAEEAGRNASALAGGIER
jgi:drug/metabolite transporter (DMT)-like permease